MPKSAQQTRERILQAAHRLFRRVGFFRAGIDEIALASGVTKRTVYHHFESKDALLAAVLTAQHEQAFAIPHPYGVRLEGTPEELIDAMFDELARWSATPYWAGSGFTRLAMELADLPGHPARAVAHRHKAWLESYLENAFGAAGAPGPGDFAKQLALLIEGAMVMILIHGDRSYVGAAATAAKRLLDTTVVVGVQPR
jgi:AcrR family transcriptional regulator